MGDIYECNFTDPYKNQPLAFKIVPTDNLEVTPHQRRHSEYHVKQLVTSIGKLGFLVPLMVITKEGQEGKYIIIDGQHRFLAALEMSIDKLPVIVIPPSLGERMMDFNTEKELNIREKAYISLSIYREYLSQTPNTLESEPKIMDSIENAYYVTLGMGYEKTDRLSGSAFEPVLRRSDFFLGEPLKKAYSVRDERAGKVIAANNLASEIVQKVKEMGQWNPYIFNQIISWANPYKGRRIAVDFNELFPQLLSNLEKAKQNPQQVLNEILRTEEQPP